MLDSHQKRVMEYVNKSDRCQDIHNEAEIRENTSKNGGQRLPSRQTCHLRSALTMSGNFSASGGSSFNPKYRALTDLELMVIDEKGPIRPESG